MENSIETDIIENANFAFEGYFGNKTLGLGVGQVGHGLSPYLMTKWGGCSKVGLGG